MADPGDITRNYHRNHPNSNAAYQNTTRHKKQQDRSELYTFVFTRGLLGATADEADAALGKGHQTTSARFSDLKADGELIDSGKTRRTRKNCAAAVFVAKPVWQAFLQSGSQLSLALPDIPEKYSAGEA